MPEAVSKVLDDDNLLIEVLLCVGFPTTLVRAAIVCKRWYNHASDCTFLCRFRKRHPPCLLGFYVNRGSASSGLSPPLFVHVQPQPPELTTVIFRVASHSFGTYENRLWIMDCQNGIVFTRHHEGVLTHGVHCPLYRKRDMAFIPPPPRVQDRNPYILVAVLSKEEGDDLSYFCMLVKYATEKGKFKVHIYMLQDGKWYIHASVTDHFNYPRVGQKPVLINNKIYMVSSLSGEITVLDLTALTFSTIQPPQGVESHYFSTIFSQANDPSGVYLIHDHAEEFQLRIWLHKEDSWLLVDTICLHDMRAVLGMSDHCIEEKDIGTVKIIVVGENA
ncbi:uncharacterized protein LOC119344712 [Triticum dicoccoides]|uniref:uncharacterized protein LOC119344712 n=1 Tax=Triticum dicoccoides TaxID=85692 RepID=UPI0018900562|nr:uncharacterized protein LOC119344712 [Triticum dicoccoides]